MKFILFVERETEKKVLPSFLRKWLDARLNDNVGIQTVKFSGFSEITRDRFNGFDLIFLSLIF